MSFSRIFTSLPLKFVTKHSCPKLVQNQVATGVGCINCPINFIRSKRIISKDLKSLSGKAAPGQKAVALKLGISQVSISYILMEQVIHRLQQAEGAIHSKKISLASGFSKTVTKILLQSYHNFKCILKMLCPYLDQMLHKFIDLGQFSTVR